MSEHTPGPWKFSDRGDGIYRIEARQGPLDVMPAISHGLSDAQLIAAAPDMLEALRAVRAFHLSPEVTNLVYDAIAKAEGR